MKINSGQGLTYPLILTPLILLLLAACASAPAIGGPLSGKAWPPPPDKARILFIKSVSGTEDVERTKVGGWIKKTWTLLTGATVEKALIVPYGVAVDREGNAFVADRETREIFSFNLKKEKAFSFLFDSGDFEDYPICIGIADNVYVSYPNRGNVRIFSKSGKYTGEIGKDAGIKRPTGVAVNIDRSLLYVADTTGHEVRVFDLTGKPMFAFGARGESDGEFNYPTHIFAARDGTVYVTDELNFRVQAFTFDGKFLFRFGKIGTVPGTFQSPKGVAVDSDGNVYVADAMADTIQVFSRDGKLLLFFGGSGSKDGEFWGPTGMFIDKEDRIYITDMYNRRVQVFQYIKSE